MSAPCSPTSVTLSAARSVAKHPHRHQPCCHGTTHAQTEITHTRAHTFIPLRHGFLSLCCWAHPPAKGLWIPTISPPSAPSAPPLPNLSLPPFIHSDRHGRRSDGMISHVKGRTAIMPPLPTHTSAPPLAPIFCHRGNQEVTLGRGRSNAADPLGWTDSFSSFNLCFRASRRSPSVPEENRDGTRWGTTETAGPWPVW